MTPEEFRQAGHLLVDWIASYRESLDSLPVRADVSPGEARQKLPVRPPPGKVGIDKLLSDLDEIVVPGLTHVQHPRNFAWFPANASLSSVLGDLASSGLGALGLSWQAAPALTEMEEAVVGWMRELGGLSERWRGVIQDTASTSCLVALLVARERATGYCQESGGLVAEQAALSVYTSAAAHTSVAKAALLAGFGRDNLRLIDCDPATYAMRPDALAAAMAADSRAGRRPAAVVATIGTTATTAIDPVSEIVGVAARYGAFVHVDAALAGSAMLLPECAHLFEGVEGADSLCWNPHKWMGTALDTSLFYVRDVPGLVRVMATRASYLAPAGAGPLAGAGPAAGPLAETPTELRDWGIPLGRRFRALKLYFQLYLDGIEEIRSRLRRDLENASWLESQVRSAAGWEVLAPVPLQTVCVRHDPSWLSDRGSLTAEASARVDRHTLSWSEALNATGRAYVTPARLDGRWMVRCSIGAEGCERADVEELWRLMRECAEVAERAGAGRE